MLSINNFAIDARVDFSTMDSSESCNYFSISVHRLAFSKVSVNLSYFCAVLNQCCGYVYGRIHKGCGSAAPI